MWKTLGGFWAQMALFAYILPPETAQIHCGAAGLALFRRPNFGRLRCVAGLHFAGQAYQHNGGLALSLLSPSTVSWLASHTSLNCSGLSRRLPVSANERLSDPAGRSALGPHFGQITLQPGPPSPCSASLTRST
jgi:hypothetical protein